MVMWPTQVFIGTLVLGVTERGTSQTSRMEQIILSKAKLAYGNDSQYFSAGTWTEMAYEEDHGDRRQGLLKRERK